MSLIRKSGLLLLPALLVISFIATADAGLSPMAFGFPTAIQSGTTTNWNQALGSAWDLESANVGFGGFGGMLSTPGSTTGFSTGSAFPTLDQTNIQGQAVTATQFSQSTQFGAFSYPSVNLGSGFAGFGNLNSFGFGF